MTQKEHQGHSQRVCMVLITLLTLLYSIWEVSRCRRLMGSIKKDHLLQKEEYELQTNKVLF
tara:strand:- start:1609 stop:1791 length:183 start_codon:yes stop_codon:yes gene_type:complete